jgi:hypothetical protein
MLTITSNEQAEELIKDGVLAVDDDIELACDLKIEADLRCRNISCKNGFWDIDCWNINCENIKCWNINCWNINCWNIDCEDINCENIDCLNINYYAICFAYKTFKCKSVKGHRENSRHFCLDSEIEYKK